MHQFNEVHFAFKGFSEAYEKHMGAANIGTKFYGLETVQPAILASFAALIIFAICLFLLSITRLPFPALIIPVLGLGVLGYIIYDANKYPNNVKLDDKHIELIAAQIGLKSIVETQINLRPWQHLGLLTNAPGKVVIFINLAGNYAGHHITIKQVEILEPNSSMADTKPRTHLLDGIAFNGYLIVAEMPKGFSGRTVMIRDGGDGQSKRYAGLNKIGLVDPIFENIFEVYGSDQVQSRVLLPPDLMQRLVDLNSDIFDKFVEFGFIEGKLLIKLIKPTRDTRAAFDSGEQDILVIQHLIDDISDIFKAIDAFAL